MDAKAVVEGWLDAVQAQDTERMLGHLADDIEMRAEDMARPIVGKDTLRRLFSAVAGTYELVRVDREQVICSGNDVAVLVRTAARLRSDLQFLGETLPVAGKEVNLRGALFIKVDDAGKIARIVRIRDNLEVARQLGLSPDRMRSLAEKLEQKLAA